VVEVLRQPFGVRKAVRSESVGDPERLFEAAAAGAELDQESGRLVGGVAEVVERVLRRDRLLPCGQRASFAADHHLQRARDHLEVFGVGQVVVRCSPPAWGDLDLNEGALATGLLARFQEGRVVLLDRVVDPPRVLLSVRADCFSSHESRSPFGVVVVIPLNRQGPGRWLLPLAPRCPPRLWPRTLPPPAPLCPEPGGVRPRPSHRSPSWSCSLASLSRLLCSSSVLAFRADRFPCVLSVRILLCVRPHLVLYMPASAPMFVERVDRKSTRLNSS